MARNLDRVGGVAQAAANAGVLINRKNIRFLDGGGVTWIATDDPGNDEVEITAAASGSIPDATTVVPGKVLLAVNGGVVASTVVQATDTRLGTILARRNTGANVGPRPRINLIEGAGITITMADDPGNGEIDITIATTVVAGALVSVQSVGAAGSLTWAPGFTPRVMFSSTLTDGFLYSFGVAFGTGKRQWHVDDGSYYMNMGSIINDGGPTTAWAVTSWTSGNITVARTSGAASWNTAYFLVLG